MSRYSDTSDSDRRREERREYEGDVFYEVWRSGRDPDRIDPERVADHFYQGDPAQTAASCEIQAQRRVEERHQEEQSQEEEYYRQQEEAYYASQSEQPPPTEEKKP